MRRKWLFGLGYVLLCGLADWTWGVVAVTGLAVGMLLRRWT